MFGDDEDDLDVFVMVFGAFDGCWVVLKEMCHTRYCSKFCNAKNIAFFVIKMQQKFGWCPYFYSEKNSKNEQKFELQTFAIILLQLCQHTRRLFAQKVHGVHEMSLG